MSFAVGNDVMNMQSAITGCTSTEPTGLPVALHDGLTQAIPVWTVVGRVPAVPAPVALAGLITGLAETRLDIHDLLSCDFAGQPTIGALDQHHRAATGRQLIKILLQDNKLARNILDENGAGRQVPTSASATGRVLTRPNSTALLEENFVTERTLYQGLEIMARFGKLLQDNDVFSIFNKRAASALCAIKADSMAMFADGAALFQVNTVAVRTLYKSFMMSTWIYFCNLFQNNNLLRDILNRLDALGAWPSLDTRPAKRVPARPNTGAFSKKLYTTVRALYEGLGGASVLRKLLKYNNSIGDILDKFGFRGHDVTSIVTV